MKPHLGRSPPVPVTHPHARRLAVQHALAVQLEALGAVVHALKDRRGWLAHHGDAVPLFPLPAFQALDLQELPGETEVESWAAASQNASLLSRPCIPQRQEQPGCPSLVLKPPSVVLCHATPQHNPCSARTFPSPRTGLGVPGTFSHPPTIFCSTSNCSLPAPQPLWVRAPRCLVLPPVAAYFARRSEPPPVNPAGPCPAPPEAPLCTLARAVNPTLAEELPHRSRPTPSCAAETAPARTTCQKDDEKEKEQKARSGAHPLLCLLSLAAIQMSHRLHRDMKTPREALGELGTHRRDPAMTRGF